MSSMKRELSRLEQQAEQALLLAKQRKTFALIAAMDSRNHRPRLVSIVTQCGDVIYDPIRQPKLHAASQRELIRAQAERTNQVFRAAVEQRQPAPARARRGLARALIAVSMMWDVRIARLIESHETELEFAGEMRPCTVSYVIDDGDLIVKKVVMERLIESRYNFMGDYAPAFKLTKANVTALLSPAQIKGLMAEITAELQEKMA